MRQSREGKAETREAIVAEASRLFRARGVEGTSVADVMGAAQRTHGGFYRHFDTKDDLLQTALAAAFTHMREGMEAGLGATAHPDSLARFVRHYLAPAQVADVGGGCPAAALSAEVARGSDALRRTFGDGARHLIDTMAQALDGPVEERRDRAARAFCMAMGALLIARASDDDTADLVLDAARSGAASL